MADVTYDFENGSDGDPLTTALTGGTITNGGTFTADSMHGNLAGNFQDQKVIRWSYDSCTRLAFRCYVKTTVAPSADLTFASIRYSGGVTYAVAMGTDGSFHATASTSGFGGGAIAATIGTWYRVELVVDTTAQTGELHVYEGDATTEIGSQTGSSLTIAGSPLVASDIGIVNSATADVTIDDVAFRPDATAEIGPYTPPANEDGAYLYTGGSWVRVTVAS